MGGKTGQWRMLDNVWMGKLDNGEKIYLKCGVKGELYRYQCTAQRQINRL